MGQLADLLDNLRSDDSTVRRKSAYSIESLIEKDGNLAFPEGAVARMAEDLADADRRFWVVYVLEVMANRGQDISAAVSALEEVARLPRVQGFRENAVVALEKHGINTGEYSGEPPRLESQEDWELQSTTHRPLFGTGGVEPTSLPKSSLLCAICTGTKTVMSHQSISVSGTNISGGETITHEHHCLDCGVYSVWSQSDSW
jgi:hypothetical protein